jgi:hypothetical protein
MSDGSSGRGCGLRYRGVDHRAVKIRGDQEADTKPSTRTIHRGVLGALAALSLLAALAPARPAAADASGPIQDMMFDLQIIPLDGAAAKPFALRDLDGRRVSLADHKGRVMLLYFWATW